MPQRLPLISTVGVLALLAGTLSSHAAVTPVRRPPAVPPLPIVQPQPDAAQPMTAQPITAPAPTAQNGIAGLAPVSTLPLPPPVDTAAQKRDARAEARADISITALTRPLNLTQLQPIEFALNAPEPELMKPLEQIAMSAPKPLSFVQPAPIKLVLNKAEPELVTPLEQIAMSAPKSLSFVQLAPIKLVVNKAEPELVTPLEQIALSGQNPLLLPVKFSYTAVIDPVIDTPTDLAKFLPDVELKSISQDADLSYRASIAPFSLEESAPVKVATLSLPDIAAIYEPSISLYYNVPVSLYVGGVADETEAAETLPPTTPRRRPHNLLASNETRSPASEQAPAESSFELRR